MGFPMQTKHLIGLLNSWKSSHNTKGAFLDIVLGQTVCLLLKLINYVFLDSGDLPTTWHLQEHPRQLQVRLPSRLQTGWNWNFLHRQGWMRRHWQMWRSRVQKSAWILQVILFDITPTPTPLQNKSLLSFSFLSFSSVVKFTVKCYLLWGHF